MRHVVLALLVCCNVAGCALWHGPGEPMDDPGGTADACDAVPLDVGRAVLANDNDWWHPGPGARGDYEATLRAIAFIEDGVPSPRILMCGSRAELDLTDDWWLELTGDRTIDVRPGCAGEVATLTLDYDIILFTYVTSSGEPWALPPPSYTPDDTDAVVSFFLGGGRIISLFEGGGTFGGALDAVADTTCDMFTVHDGDRTIGMARFLGGP